MAKDLKKAMQNVFTSPVTPEVSKNTEPETGAKQEKRKDAPKEGEDRYTYLVNNDLADKMKDISYWSGQLVKETVNEAFELFIANYEKKHGSVKSRPEEVKRREGKRSNSGRKS